MEDDVYPTGEISRLLNVSPATVVNWIRDGRISAYRTAGGHRRVRRRELVRFIRQNGFPIPPELADVPLKVLVIEDEERVRSTLVAALEGGNDRGPMELRAAADGTSGLIEVGRFRPDVLVLDILLPGIDGLEVCRRIRSFDDLSVRVVAISGSPDPDMRDRALAAGADAFFEKPLNVLQLLEEVWGGREGAPPPGD